MAKRAMARKTSGPLQTDYGHKGEAGSGMKTQMAVWEANRPVR
jgi:hypothetical protein